MTSSSAVFTGGDSPSPCIIGVIKFYNYYSTSSEPSATPFDVSCTRASQYLPTRAIRTKLRHLLSAEGAPVTVVCVEPTSGADPRESSRRKIQFPSRKLRILAWTACLISRCHGFQSHLDLEVENTAPNSILGNSIQSLDKDACLVGCFNSIAYIQTLNKSTTTPTTPLGIHRNGENGLQSQSNASTESSCSKLDSQGYLHSKEEKELVRSDVSIGI